MQFSLERWNLTLPRFVVLGLLWRLIFLDGLSSYAEEFRASLAISQYSLSFVVCFTGEYNTAEILAVVGHLIHICLPTLYIYGGKLSEQSYSDMVILQTVYHVNVPCSTVVLHSVAHGHRNGGKELWLLKLAFPLKPCESSKVFILSVSYWNSSMNRGERNNFNQSLYLIL